MCDMMAGMMNELRVQTTSDLGTLSRCPRGVGRVGHGRVGGGRRANPRGCAAASSLEYHTMAEKYQNILSFLDQSSSSSPSESDERVMAPC